MIHSPMFRPPCQHRGLYQLADLRPAGDVVCAFARVNPSSHLPPSGHLHRSAASERLPDEEAKVSSTNGTVVLLTISVQTSCHHFVVFGSELREVVT